MACTTIFGNNLVGPSFGIYQNFSQGARHSRLFHTACAGDTLINANCYSGNPFPATLYMALYTVVAGLPAVRVAGPWLNAVGVAPAWITEVVSVPLTSGTTYCLAFAQAGRLRVAYTVADPSIFSQDITNHCPPVWTEDASFNRNHSLYGTVFNTKTKLFFPCKAQLIE